MTEPLCFFSVYRLIFVSHCVLCRLELPSGVMLLLKVKPNQSVRACLEPILSRQGLSSDHVIAHLVSTKDNSYFVLICMASDPVDIIIAG